METEITSASNPKFRHLLQLKNKSRARREEQLFLLEGRQELDYAISNKYTIHSIWRVKEWMPTPLPTNTTIYNITPDLYGKIAYRGSTEGVLAVAYEKQHLLPVEISRDALILVLHGLEKPGNIGAIIRTAKAAGADYVILSDCPTDLYNPNLIRGSVGTIFEVNIAIAGFEEVVNWCKDHQIPIFTSLLQGGQSMYALDFKGKVAIVMGEESNGLPEKWRTVSDASVYIPMKSNIDSLNVSNAAAILLYEAFRQRHGY